MVVDSGVISVAASRSRRAWRMFVRALALLSGGTLLLCLAWLVTNLVDDAPSARPPVLALPAPPAAAQQEAFFYWVGLTHVDTPSPAQTGRAQWQEEVAIAQALRAVPRPTAEQLPKRTERAVLPRLQGPPLHCPDDDDCAAYWRTGRTERTQPQALADQLAPHAALGERCAGAPEEFVELVPPPLLTGPFAAHAGNANQCMLWWNAQAVLSATRGERTSALAQLGRSDRLMRALLTGGHTLTGQVIASSMAHRQWQTLASVAAAQPQWLVDLLPLVAAPDARALDVRRWVAAEAAFQHEAFADIRRGCEQHGDGAPWGLSWLNRMMCRYDIGMQPHITGAEIDRYWLDLIEGVGSDPAAWLRRQAQAASDDGLHWRNTVGRLLLAVAAPAWSSYVARLVDVELHRQALLAAWAAREVPAQDRARWLAARALPTLAQGRLSLSADGRWLLAQPWSPDAAKQARLRIRIELPAV